MKRKKPRDTFGRLDIDLTGRPENFISRNCDTPFQFLTSSQRRDLATGFLPANIIGCEVERPLVDSNLAADMIKHSSCIQEITSGKIELVDKISYQLRTIYIYILDGEVQIYDDNCGTVINQRSVNNMYTDLDKLEKGVEYDLDNKDSDSFYVKYPHFYNPNNGLYGYGRNILSTVATEFDNSQDSVAVSESFLDKFISRESRTIILTLNSKRILSKWSTVFPPIGEMLGDNQFIFKIISSEGDMYTLAQSSNLPAGEEDDAVVTYPNSMLVSVEVYSNEPITEDATLEKFRKELIKFRTEVYLRLKSLKTRGYKFSNEALIYLENFSYTKVRTNKEIIEHPTIVLRIDNLSRPNKGFKFTNRYGGKYTVQRVYKDGAVKDEYGRNIELCYSGVGIINRMNPSTIVELWFSGLHYHIQKAYKEKRCTLQDIKDFYLYLYDQFKNKVLMDRLLNSIESDEEFEEIILNKQIPIILLPVSPTDNIIEVGYKIRKMAKEKFGYRKLKIHHFTGDNNVKYSTVGYLYTLRLRQDPTTQTSAVSNPEMDKRNIIKDDDENKKKGLSIIKKKASKHCVQTNHLSLNMVPDAIMFENTVGSDGIMTTIEENCVGIGMQLKMIKNKVDEEGE